MKRFMKITVLFCVIITGYMCGMESKESKPQQSDKYNDTQATKNAENEKHAYWAQFLEAFDKDYHAELSIQISMSVFSFDGSKKIVMIPPINLAPDMQIIGFILSKNKCLLGIENGKVFFDWIDDFILLILRALSAIPTPNNRIIVIYYGDGFVEYRHNLNNEGTSFSSVFTLKDVDRQILVRVMPSNQKQQSSSSSNSTTAFSSISTNSSSSSSSSSSASSTTCTTSTCACSCVESKSA